MGFEPMTSAFAHEHVTVLSISKGYKHRALPTTPTEPVVKMGFEPMRANTAVLKTAPLDQLGHFTIYTNTHFFNFIRTGALNIRGLKKYYGFSEVQNPKKTFSKNTTIYTFGIHFFLQENFF